MKKAIVSVLVTFMLTGCIAITSAGVDNLVEKGGERVSVNTSGMGILALTTPETSELEVAAVNLLKGKGATKNITTRLELRNFVVVQLYSVTATGEK